MRDAAIKAATDIAAYCAEAGISESTFGRLAVGDSTFVPRLREGRVTINIVDRAMTWLERQRCEQPVASGVTRVDGAGDAANAA